MAFTNQSGFFPEISISRVRVRVRVSSFVHTQTCLLLVFHLLFSSLPISSALEISYAQHCNSIVPESTTAGSKPNRPGFLQLQTGFFRTGDHISLQYPYFASRFLSLTPTNLYSTESDGVLKIEANLEIRGANLDKFSNLRSFNRSGHLRTRFPRIGRIRDSAIFQLHGFYSEITGNLCMVGSSSVHSNKSRVSDISAVFKLHFPKSSTIKSSFVTGSVESLDNADTENYFQPIYILEYSQLDYEYTMILESKSVCSSGNPAENSLVDAGSLGIDRNRTVCHMISRASRGYQLGYSQNCTHGNCSPFDGAGLGFLPSTMFIHGIECNEKGKTRFSLGFSNTSGYRYNADLIPESTLVFEGVWDDKMNQLCMVGCHVMNFTGTLEETSVGDCTIGLSLRFPATLSLRHREIVLGQIWSNKSVNDSGYFEKILFGKGLDHRVLGDQRLRYKYTEMNRVRRSCGADIVARKKDIKNSGRRYPDGSSFGDMRFGISVKNSLKQRSYGSLTPFTKGERLYEEPFVMAPNGYLIHDLGFNFSRVQKSNYSQLNMSYSISFSVSHDFKWGGLLPSETVPFIPVNIAAEGIYDVDTGMLCMIGCLYADSNKVNLNKNLESMDCEILMNVQFSPLNSESFAGEHLRGTIKSTREKSDPLYFDPLELSANVIYANQSKKSIWRMDLEIAMVMISVTLASVFIGLQLFYVKKHVEVLPSISFLMLLVLTLGHMLPLLLNFEAFFSNHKRQDGLLGTGSWLEVNEVIVRVVTMVAFLLQCRLLQLTWSARSKEGKKRLWDSEKKSLYSCLPLYVIGGLVACLVHWKASAAPLHGRRFLQHARHSLWEDLRSYAGLVLDGFLLPQVILNFFLDSNEKVLAPSFYIGNTIVRALPHLYDAYRAGRFIPQFDASYFYANPNWDFYSRFWDVIIPCGGLVFAIIIFLQQSFGGRFFLPRKLRDSVEYQKVPVVNG